MKHKCIECNNLVYRKTALRCRICANRYIASHRDTSFWKSEKFSKLSSNRMKLRLKNPKNHPLYIDGRSLGKCKCSDCGKKISQTSVMGNGRCKKCAKQGKLNSAYKDGITLKNHYCKSCEKKVSLGSVYNTGLCTKCYSETTIGENNSNYIHGQGYAPYPIIFNESLKDKIRNRDNRECQNCWLKEIAIPRKLDIHHIDYNKENCNENNLITLCQKCNIKANQNIDYWFAYYTYLMESKCQN